MNFLLDTNAVSEWVKPRPNPGLIRWMEEADEDRVFLSVISLAELHYGIERMAGERGATGLRVGFDMNYQCVSKAEFFRSTTQSRRHGGEPFRAARLWGGPWARWMRSYQPQQKPIA